MELASFEPESLAGLAHAVLPGGQSHEILNSSRCRLTEHSKHDATGILPIDLNVEEDFLSHFGQCGLHHHSLRQHQEGLQHNDSFDHPHRLLCALN